jgi:hypothetical protein
VEYDLDDLGPFMNTTDPCIPANQIEICGPDNNSNAMNLLQRRTGGDGARIQRGFVEMDTTGLVDNLNVRVTFQGTMYLTSYKPKAYIIYKVGDLAGSNPNQIYDAPSWTSVGFVEPTHSVSISTDYYVNLSGLLP